MKKQFSLIIILFLLIGITYSCKKDEDIILNNTTSNKNCNLKSSSYRLRRYKEFWGWVWIGNEYVYTVYYADCINFSGNCLPTVVIHGNAIDEISVYDNFVAAYNSGDMTDYFKEINYKSIFPLIDSLNVIDGLRNGTIKLHYYHNSDDNLEYYIGLPDTAEYSLYDSTWVNQKKIVLVFDKQ